MGRFDWRRLFLSLAVAAALACAAVAGATPFGFIGPRALGMGGAGVAATEDAQAIYWNPAGLALHDGFDIRISGTARAAVNDNLDQTVKKIKDALNSGDLSQETIDRIDDLSAMVRTRGDRRR
jgi:long-subunit fatty acid transport protein